MRLFSSEMKALRQEINELWTFVRAFASEQPTPVVPPSMSARAARYDGFDKNSGSACGSTLWSNKRSLMRLFVVDLFRNIGIKCLRYFNSSRTMLLDQLRCDFQRIYLLSALLGIVRFPNPQQRVLSRQFSAQTNEMTDKFIDFSSLYF